MHQRAVSTVALFLSRNRGADHQADTRVGLHPFRETREE